MSRDLKKSKQFDKLQDEPPGETQQERLLRRPEVCRLVAMSRSALYARIAAGEFPRPVVIGKQSVAWRITDLNRWMSQLSNAQQQ